MRRAFPGSSRPPSALHGPPLHLPFRLSARYTKIIKFSTDGGGRNKKEKVTGEEQGAPAKDDEQKSAVGRDASDEN